MVALDDGKPTNRTEVNLSRFEMREMIVKMIQEDPMSEFKEALVDAEQPKAIELNGKDVPDLATEQVVDTPSGTDSSRGSDISS